MIAAIQYHIKSNASYNFVLEKNIYTNKNTLYIAIMDHCYNTRLQSKKNRTFEKIDRHGRIVLKDGERIGKPLRCPGQTYEKIDRNGNV